MFILQFTYLLAITPFMKREDPQATKLKLEIDKLKSDIRKADTPTWKNADFWKSILPQFISNTAVLITLYFTIGKSFIDDEKRKLELQKEQLKLEVMQFENTKKDIQKDISVSTKDRNILEGQIKKLNLQKDSLKSSVKQLGNQTGLLRNENDEIRLSYQKDKKFYQNELKNTYALQKNYLEELSAVQDTSNQKDVKIAGVNAINLYLLTKIRLTKDEQREMRLAQLKATADEHGKIANKYSAQADKLKDKYEEDSQNFKTKTAEELERFFELYFLKSEANSKQHFSLK